MSCYFVALWCEAKKKASLMFPSERPKTWQRPTFPGDPSIIGAEELNYRVRNGNGCDLLAIATRIDYRRIGNLFWVNLVDGRRYLILSRHSFATQADQKLFVSQNSRAQSGHLKSNLAPLRADEIQERYALIDASSPIQMWHLKPFSRSPKHARLWEKKKLSR